MQLMKKMGKHSLFLRLLVPYLIFIVLAMLLGWVIYAKTLQLFEDEVSRNNMHILEQAKSTLERRLAEVEMVVQQLRNDPKIMRLQHVLDPFEGAMTYRIWDTQRQLYNYNLSNNFILDYYIYYNKSDIVLSPHSTYEMPKFYESVLFDPKEGLDEWRDRFFNGYSHRNLMPTQRVVYHDRPYDMLIYRQSLGYPNDPQGTIMVLIDNREVLKLFEGISSKDGSSIYVMDEQGQIIISIGADPAAVQPMNREELLHDGPSGLIKASPKTADMTITYTTSRQNGWSYVVAQPPHIVLEKVFYIKNIVFTAAAIFILFGILLAYFFTYRSNKPLKAIVRTLNESFHSEDNKTGNPFFFIQRSVSDLVDNNTRLQKEMRRQAPLLRAALFEQLLKGEVIGEKNIETALLHQNLHLNDRFCGVALLQFTGYDHSLSQEMLKDLDYKRVILKEAMHRLLGEHIYDHDVSEDKIALLFFDNSDHREDCERLIKQSLETLSAEIMQGLNISFAIGVGGIYESRMEISKSYEEARQALSFHGREQTRGIIWFDSLPQEQTSYYYPLDAAVRLVNVAKSGDWHEVERLLDELYRNNFVERHLPLPLLQLFICDLVANLAKLHEQVAPDTAVDIRPLMGQVHDSDDMKKIYDAVVEHYRAICDHVNERKRSQNLRLLDDILRLIDGSYMQADLNLDAAADRLLISKVYLSQFFKEQTGINFSDYIENKRMEEARKLLVSTEMAVNDISERVGYNSSNTFCRAFKRSNGLSPLGYRKATNPHC
ncbi:helix-turn-helix domain-containing protein [Paenibacillus sp. GCM10012307]|uniref:Helix-turn-helix domain-containing protein n=1 Tax=Paenibacillus roseus TaxID=2798579 RepID=A0A934MMH1_9BACL|nr:helix-turn-helix domain-containing protein [Paenibacillus roseus]MBJ6359936.1 helix-turn-helix domain-containing protein [Paenibacillus roseus]